MKYKKLDWKTIQTRYLAGEELREISNDLKCSHSTLASKAHKLKWPEMRRQMQKARISKKNESIESLSSLVRQKLASDALQSLERVEQYSIAELQDETKREQVVSSIAKRSALVFGWEESQQSAQISINLLSAMPDKAHDSNAIDV